MHGISGVQLHDHSYSVRGPSNSNVEIDHPYTCTTLCSVSSAHDIQGTETIQGTDYFNFRVPGDGNCFFNSLSLALNSDFTKSRHYRSVICMHVVRNWEIYKDLATITHDLTRTCISLYCQHMLAQNGWATACEVRAACDVLQTNITICLKGQTNGRIHYTLESYHPTTISNDNITLLLSDQHYTLFEESNHFQRHALQPPSASSAQDSAPKHNNKNTTKSKTYANPKKIPTVRKRNYNRTCNTNHADKVQSCNNATQDATNTDTCSYSARDNDLHQTCRKLGVSFQHPTQTETQKDKKLRHKRINYSIQSTEKKLHLSVQDLPAPPPLSPDPQYNHVMDCIRDFELQQMSYTFNFCNICKERNLEMKMATENICLRCYRDKSPVKMFSVENNMDPGEVPDQLANLTVVEQQLICRLSPAIQVHMLKHGGIAANGHCVTFPQNVNEPSQILPRLPSEINLIRVRKQGKNNTNSDFNVRRFVVQHALTWLKMHNPAYSDITISQSRLDQLPDNGPVPVATVETTSPSTCNDEGPAPQQSDPGEVEGDTVSGVSLPDPCINIREEVERVVEEVVGPNHGPVTSNRKSVTIPWPTRDNVPLSEFTTKYFFTLAFPSLFPYGSGDFHINRPRTCESMSDWAEHLLWFKDGRFAQHQYFKFIVHNIIMRKRTLEQSSFIVKQQLGENPLTLEEIKEKIQHGDMSIGQKILYFGAFLRGTSQYWAQRKKELRSLLQFAINEGNGLPSFFTTGSCAEYHFKPLRRLLEMYTADTSRSGADVDLSNHNTLFAVLQKNTHIVSRYFDLRTKSYFEKVMQPAFNVSAYWYRQEFAKSRGMIHWHGLCWRQDKEPHHLLHEAMNSGLTNQDPATALSDWAKSNFRMTALHPAGTDADGCSRKDLWSPPEGTAPAPPDEKNPLIKLLMDVSDTQESLLEDHLLLTNKINIHRCSDFCWTKPKRGPNQGQKVCRMEFGPQNMPGKILRDTPAIVKDKNGSLRLEMQRDHPMLVQHSMYHTQGWRANGDISLILSKSSPDNPSVEDIIATEKYITGYACKGNQPTGAVVELFNDIANSADETTGANAQSVCTKLLMNTVKRDISSMEATYELIGLPLYRCSHQFQNVSFSGSRVLERSGSTLTKTTPLDKYLARPAEEVCSWYQYVCKQGKVPVVSGTCLRATWPLNEDYSRSMLLLHWPNWRKISDIKAPDLSWTQIMTGFLDSEHCPNFIRADVVKAKHKSPEHDSDSDSELSNDDEVQQPDWMGLLQPNPDYSDTISDFVFDDGGPHHDWSGTTHNYPPGLGIKFIGNLDEIEQTTNDVLHLPEVDLSLLNKEQRFAFNLVMLTLIQSRENPSSVELLRLVVSGTAGSGKSFLVKCLVHSIRKLFQNNKSVQVLGPTGNSAKLLSGQTIHSFLKIPTGKDLAKDMVPPDGVKGEALQKNCSDLCALLVDERSLVGCTTLGWMEFLCKHGKKNSELSWGGIPVVVLLGDDVQLPPVCDSPVYLCSGKTPAALHGALVWREFRVAVALKTIIRQNQSQAQLREVLMSMREHITTQQQAKWLQQFQWDNLKSTYGEQLMQDMSAHGLYVFPTHLAEWNHNKTQLLKANQNAPIAKLSAIDQGQHAKRATSDKAAGLQQTLYLCQGARVMLTSNLHVMFGLFNGSIGTVIDIVYLDGRNPKDSLPDVVMVDFDKYTGPAFLPETPTIVSIAPVERRIDCFCHGCKRKQVPLRLGWGTTIHRCQGMTIGRGETNRYIIIDPGTKQFESRNPGALFVALSRAKTAGGPGQYPDFAWHPDVLVNEDRLCHRADTPTTKARHQELSRISLLSDKTKEVFKMFNSDDVFDMILATLQPAFPVEE